LRFRELETNGFVSLGVCLLGRNLNSVSIRGFTNIAKLASVSGPDTFDPVDNPLGTQRALAPKHSREAGNYALESLNISMERDIRVFPEVMLNIRDTSVVVVVNPVTGKPLTKSELRLTGLEDSIPVEVKIKVSKLDRPVSRYEPQIARVDGNHRLSQISKILEESEVTLEEFPVVPFALHIGLSRHQETKLFVDINKNHKGMSTNLILTMGSTLAGASMRDAIGKRADYLAVELAKQRLFKGMVDLGGDKANFQANFGVSPPISLSLLRYSMKSLMAQAPQTSVRFRAEPERMLEVISIYFQALAQVLPEMWGDKERFILFKSIGMIGFGQLGGYLLEILHTKKDLSVSDFAPYLNLVARKVNLESRAWAGIAGAAGGKKVFERCLLAITGRK
jgi:DGQHR domain-containing protein